MDTISYVQKQFYINYMMYPQSPVYNICSVFKLEGKVNLNLLEESINCVIRKYDLLRSSYSREGREILQTIEGNKSFYFKVEEVKISGHFSSNNVALKEEVHQPFDLTRGLLLRVKRFNYEDGVSLLIITFHHIIIDLRSKILFGKEVSNFYNQLLHEVKKEDNSLVDGYSKYVAAEKEWMKTEECSKSIKFWQSFLPEEGFVLNLPMDFNRPEISTKKGKRIYFDVSKEITTRIEVFAKMNLLKIFTVLLGSFAILCQHLSKQNCFNIGVPLSNRRKTNYKEIFGPTLNIVPIPVNFSKIESEKEVLKDIRQSMLFAHRHQELPYTFLLNHIKFERNFSHNPVFQVGFTEEPPMELALDGVVVTPIPIEKEGAQLDLFLTFWQRENRIHFYFEYSSDLFKESTIQEWIKKYTNILEDLVA